MKEGLPKLYSDISSISGILNLSFRYHFISMVYNSTFLLVFVSPSYFLVLNVFSSHSSPSQQVRELYHQIFFLQQIVERIVTIDSLLGFSVSLYPSFPCDISQHKQHKYFA